MEVKRYILSGVVCVMFLVIRGNAETAKTASELIKKARKYDSAYTLGPQISQQKALEFYQSALAAGPNKRQRLQILFRMAQLNGCAYRASKGEKPDYQKAISFYEQIIDECPPDEPKVLAAINGISSHYTTLRQFEKALEWSKKAFEHDIRNDISELTRQYRDVEEQNTDFVFGTSTPEERLAYRRRVGKAKALRKALDVKERRQKAAVDLVAYTASHIDLFRAHGELSTLIKEHPDTVISERAARRLAENMEKMPDIWAPQSEPVTPSESAIQAYSPTPLTNLSQKQVSIQTQPSSIMPKPEEEPCSAEPGAIEKSQKHDHTTEVRAPPFAHFSECVFVAIGLIVLGLGIIIVKKKRLFKEFEK